MLTAMLLMVMPQPLLAQDAETKTKREKLVCRSQRPVGSRISERVCKTAAEWDALANDTRQGLDRLNGRNNRAEPPKVPIG